VTRVSYKPVALRTVPGDQMPRTTLRPRIPSRSELASRPENRLCSHCNEYFHKDLLARHLAKQHGIVVKLSPKHEPSKSTVAQINPILKTNRTAKLRSAKQDAVSKQGSISKTKRRYAIMEYDTPSRFEGGIRWSQAGSPGLGKRR
jgi:hypothetical protein